MEKWELWLLIALVIGVILSNLMVLKHTANMKLPPFLGRKDKLKSDEDGTKKSDNAPSDYDKDDWGKQDWKKDEWDKDDWK
ncbi:DUF2897 family protein [Ferrimonas balearica]|uniref:DUF2897 family protein n=1 Tax=Ferrimonas balearica TaxID=44012 RepID=UPI001F437026|nr:DUF2897 family protein [Ferrimonas balearica]MBY6017184.1 DUF2897 family protein [Halomonas denitrificans]MBY6093460.1 DUF2897 family protein [Ferrimonas balearica]